MKLALVLESDVTEGGGYHQGLNAALEIQRRAAGRHEVVVWTDAPANVQPLEAMGMRPCLYRRGWRDRVLKLIELSQLGRRVTSRVPWLDSLERTLLREGTDLVYFVSPSFSAARLKSIAFIATVWDLCHRDWPEFPEVGTASEHLAREAVFGESLRRAQVVVADSEQLADNIARWYGVNRERVLAVPFGPSPFIGAREGADDESVPRSYGLQPGYFFYPAQFWPHKNHVRIVQALGILRDAGLLATVAFAGGDKGNQAHVRAMVSTLGLDEQVRFLGLVPSEHLRGLYVHCAGLVMPTYFGPTNLPPLEAWTVGKPVIYSKHLHEQVGDAAILVEPDSADSIAKAIRAVVENDPGRSWSALGRERLAQLGARRTAALDQLMQRLEAFERRRACWS